MDNELQGIWKEVDFASLRWYTGICLEVNL